MVTASRSKTSRGSRNVAGPTSRGPRNTAGLLSPSKQRMKVAALEKRVADLSRENRELRINHIVDLRVAGGLISESERHNSKVATTTLNDEALEIIRQHLVKIFASLNGPTGRDLEPAAANQPERDYIV